MLEFEKPEIRISDISEDEKYAKIVVEPLSRGYGTTVGNALKRLMLSSLRGIAVSRVKIAGMSWDQKVLPGIRENLDEILLNVKSLAFRDLTEEHDEVPVTLKMSGEGTVTAAELDFGGLEEEIEVVNPDQVIATILSPETTFEAEFILNADSGYYSAELEDVTEDGYLIIDAIYSPIERVDLTIEKTRVGKMTDFDRLILEVYTNGAITPQEAVSTAARIMSEHLKLFTGLTEQKTETDPIFGGVQPTETENFKDKTIDELELSVRSYNCLKRAGIGTIGELCDRSEEDMKKIRNLGKKSLEEIMQKIKELGLTLRYEGSSEA